MLARFITRTVGAVVIVAVGVLCVAEVNADLNAEFAGYGTLPNSSLTEGRTVSGFQSSYSDASPHGLPGDMFSLTTTRIDYWPGNGQVDTSPTPGGATGQLFDEGLMGLKFSGSQENPILTVKVAGRINPATGVFLGTPNYSYETWFGQGDVFLTIEAADQTVVDGDGVSNVPRTTQLKQYVLTNLWARDGLGDPILLGDEVGNPINDHFETAMDFHTPANEGKLFELTSANEVTLIGGDHGLHSGSGIDGLDPRIYANTNITGAAVGTTSFSNEKVVDTGVDWWVQTWVLPLDSITSNNDDFTIGLHKTTSCGNDQISLLYTQPEGANVPVPAGLILGVIGLGAVGIRMRKYA